ncbi:abortive infection family protein [Pseudomonas sp. BN102]|uniref:abortive infection family protein n=1 Tax=Pseudomonas sp. BN102 TaxID=2567886 RepID=UPI002454DF57|nr:abortive infection family protein [Pseudomonas sp. BN102]
MFSRRQENQEATRKKLTMAFRNRTLMVFRDATHGGLYEFMDQIHGRFAYLLGRNSLTGKRFSRPADDLGEYLGQCEDEQFLNFIEYALRFDCACFFGANRDNVVERINEFLMIDDLPYHVVPQVWEPIDSAGGRFGSMVLREEAKVIPKDSQLIHETAMQPALEILRTPAFLNANSEFIAALDDYRHRRFGDCVTKCNSSYESVMKVICGQKGFGYSQGDTTSKLLKIVMEKTGLEAFWEQPLLIIGTLRNRISTSHGAGEVEKVVPEHVAKAVINLTASAIVFLHDHAYRS